MSVDLWYSFIKSKFHLMKTFFLSAISMLLLLVVLCEPGNFSIIFSINFNISCLKRRSAVFSNAVVSTYSQQEPYFVKENSEIFSTAISASEQLGLNNAGPHQGVIVSAVISSIRRPFWICSPVRRGSWAAVLHVLAFFIIQLLVFPFTCHFSLKNDFRNPR